MPDRAPGFAIQQGPDDEDELFTKGFSELAYKALGKSNPDMVADVVTFRVLDTDASRGMGVGAFIVKHNQEVFYVPVVVSDNAVKPLDMFYSRRLDRYYPLSADWLQEASKGALTQMGTGVQPPKTLQTDVDIRNLVVPPTTGRYSYAEENPPDEVTWECFSALLKEGKETNRLQFVEFASQVSNAVKLGFAKILRQNPRLTAKFAEVYGVKNLQAALATHEKTATGVGTEFPAKHDLFIASNTTPPAYIKRELLPSEAGIAFQQVRSHGFYVKDVRKGLKDVFRLAESTLKLVEPKTPGFYRIFLANGEIEDAIVVPRPIMLSRQLGDEDVQVRNTGDNKNVDHTHIHTHHFLVLFTGGRYCKTEKLIAEPINTSSYQDVADFLDKISKDKPANGQRGSLVCTVGLTVKATEPATAHEVQENGKNTSFDTDFGFRVTINGILGGNTKLQPTGDKQIVLSKNYRWVPCTKRLSSEDLYRDAKMVQIATEHAITKEGAERIVVKRAGDQFIVAGDGKHVGMVEAVEKVARRYEVPVTAAVDAVKIAWEKSPATLWAGPKGLLKAAAGESLTDPNDPDGSPLQDPSAAQGAPQGPSGIELAVAEQMQLVQQQMAGLQQQMQMLQTLQQRAQGIDQGGGQMAAPMGAATMQAGPPQTADGQQAIAPMPPDPNQGQGQGQAPPPTDQGQGQPPPQGPPALQAGGPQPNGAMPPQPAPDPSQLPPPPVMDEDPTPDNIAAQINPNFLQEAGQLQSDDVFDAAAISSLAQQKNPKQLVQAYTPAIDKALDNVGRVLLTYYLKEPEIKEQVGNEQYTETERILRDVFRGLGDGLLRIGRESDQLLPGSTRPA